MSLLTRKKLIGAKTETTQGTAVALAATDFIHAMDIEMNPEAEILQRPLNSASIDPFASLRGKAFYQPKFKTELKASGAAGTAPPIGPLLQALGLTETIVPLTSATYAPSSTPAANFYGPGKSCTIKAYEDGILHAPAGCIGNLKLTLEPGKVGMCEWDFKGIYAAVTDAAFPANSPNAIDPPVIKSIAATIQGYTAIVHKIEIDFGNEIAEKDDVNAANGIAGFQITARKPSGSIIVDAVLVASHDFYGKHIAGTIGALSFTIETVAGKIITFSLPKTQYGKVAKTDVNGVMGLTIPLEFSRNSGDDWISIIFT